jgi:integrase
VLSMITASPGTATFRRWPPRRHIVAFPPVAVEIDDETNPRKPVKRPARLLFLNAAGDPIHRASWAHVWVPAVRRAGVPEGMGFHALRHYFATLLIHGGASVKTVQLALGHARPTITLNTYVGRGPEAIEATRALVAAGLSHPRSGPEGAGEFGPGRALVPVCAGWRLSPGAGQR